MNLPVLRVKIPKDSIEEIEKSFYSSTQKQWVHPPDLNNEIDKLSRNNPEGLSQTDQEQRRFYEETFECRQFQIRALIRQIRKFMGSQSFDGRREEIIRRTEKLESATIREQGKAAELQEAIDFEFREEEDNISRAEKRYSNLERRYYSKRDELEREIELSLGDEKENIEGFREEREGIEEELRRKIGEAEGDEIKTQQNISRLKRNTQETRINFETRREANKNSSREREQRKIEADIINTKRIKTDIGRIERNRNQTKEFLQRLLDRGDAKELEQSNQFADMVSPIRKSSAEEIGAMDRYFKIRRMSEDARNCCFGTYPQETPGIEEEWINESREKKHLEFLKRHRDSIRKNP